MNTKDYGVLVALGLLAVFVWFRDTAWMSAAEDTLPILVGIPLFYWLGKPWQFIEGKPLEIPTGALVGTAIFFLIGIVAESTFLFALGWTLLVWAWLKQRTPQDKHSSIKKLLMLPLMSFPWVTLDMQQLGWWFRISGAWVTASFFSLLGYDVKYEGTAISIDQLPINVEAACAGLNTLQSMLIAGTVMAYVILGQTNRYWFNIALIVAVAWIANTSRIILLSAVALASDESSPLVPFTRGVDGSSWS
jgi:exosortase/archaeosortase family protein